MLEKMAYFFENRLDGYEEHMMTAIEAGFSSVEVLKNWSATYIIKAVK